jgi:hypothetical protein
MQKLITLILILTLTACCSKKKAVPLADPVEDLSMDTYTESGVEVYTSLSGVSREMRTKLREKGIKRIVLVNGGHLDKGMDYKVRKNEIIDYINNTVRDPNSTAMVVLDFEGEKMAELYKTENQKVVDNIVEYYLEILDIVKRERPYATVGYYGYPFRDYWNRNDAWRKKNERLLPLFEKVDAIFPSVYDFYEDDVDVKKASDISYIKDNVEESLRFAEMFGKKVYPFVWHRYHSSNKRRKMEFINPDEFEDSIAAIVESSYNGLKASGIIWWSSERYFYNVSPRGKANKKNADADFNNFANENSMVFIDAIINGIKKGKRADK